MLFTIMLLIVEPQLQEAKVVVWYVRNESQLS